MQIKSRCDKIQLNSKSILFSCEKNSPDAKYSFSIKRKWSISFKIIWETPFFYKIRQKCVSRFQPFGKKLIGIRFKYAQSTN